MVYPALGVMATIAELLGVWHSFDIRGPQSGFQAEAATGHWQHASPKGPAHQAAQDLVPACRICQ